MRLVSFELSEAQQAGYYVAYNEATKVGPQPWYGVQMASEDDSIRGPRCWPTKEEAREVFAYFKDELDKRFPNCHVVVMDVRPEHPTERHILHNVSLPDYPFAAYVSGESERKSLWDHFDWTPEPAVSTEPPNHPDAGSW